MNRILLGLVIFIAFVFLALGAIFVIAGGVEDIAIGGILVLIAIVLLFFAYSSEKIEAARPKLIQQNFKVKMGGSGEMQEKQLKCKSCGAPLADKDLKVIQGGIMATCPYCGTVFAMEEAPKW